MARIIIHTKKAPKVEVTEKGDSVYICMCGLSNTYPLCDGSHSSTRSEDDSELYVYDDAHNQSISTQKVNTKKI